MYREKERQRDCREISNKKEKNGGKKLYFDVDVLYTSSLWLNNLH